jgi:hypothetical protein
MIKRIPSGALRVSAPIAKAPIRKAPATTGFGPSRSAIREPASAPRMAPPFNTSRNDSDPLALNPARSMSSGSQVFSE